MEDRKQNVSVRVSVSDLSKIKAISTRLGVRESDLLRFALKSMLARLSPFEEEESRGVDLLPPLIECGREVSNYFDLDAKQFEAIVNEGVSDVKSRVEPQDLNLLTWSPFEESRRKIQLASVSLMRSGDDPEDTLKNYLVKKYFRISDAFAL